MNIAFVPARCGSKSIPFKNIKNFCGKPLIFWVLSALQASKSVDKIFVATDCDNIRNIVLSFGFSKVEPYMRDPENATDESSTESVMLEFLEKKSIADDSKFLLVQPTSPFTTAADFDNALQLLEQSKKSSLLTCVRSKRFFWDETGKPINYDYKNRPRRQDFRGVFMENGAFYISSVGNIKKTNNRLTDDIVIYEMPEYTSVELDEMHDWVIAEHLMKKFVLNDHKFNDNQIRKIKIFLSDVDGTLTDAGMYYNSNGEEIKKFNARDGKGFELLKKAGIKTGFITSEDTQIVKKRASKLKIDYLYQGVAHGEKLNVVKEICKKENCTLDEVAYIGDDINCKELLENVGLAACPKDATDEVKNISNILIMEKRGGHGAVREFINTILYGLFK